MTVFEVQNGYLNKHDHQTYDRVGIYANKSDAIKEFNAIIERYSPDEYEIEVISTFKDSYMYAEAKGWDPVTIATFQEITVQ